MAQLLEASLIPALDSNGFPISGAKLYGYLSGTTTAVVLYQEIGLTTPHSSPVLSTADGRFPNVYFDDSTTTRIQIRDANGVLIRDIDPVTSTGTLGDFWNVAAFGIVPDGTDQSTKVNTAMAAAALADKALYWNAGTYYMKNIVLPHKARWFSFDGAIIKLPNGANTNLITCASNGGIGADDIYLQGLRFDGNRTNNTTGNVLNIDSNRPTIVDVEVWNAPEVGIITSTTPYDRPGGSKGYFQNVQIDRTGKNGWTHNGAGDSYFADISLTDCGLLTNNTYFGFHILSNGRFFNIHHWNRDTTSNTPNSGVAVYSSGSTFSGCHFEGGSTALYIPAGSGGHTISNSCIYAPRGPWAAIISGDNNQIDAVLGLVFASSNPTYMGIDLNGHGNIMNLLPNSNCLIGAVDFTNDPGQNKINIYGFQNGGAGYVGTPHINTDCDINIAGAASASQLRQDLPIAWTSYTPTITSLVGTITTASSVTGRYRRDGKTVHIEIDLTITTNGTGAGAVIATLPTAPRSARYYLCGRADAVSGKMLQGRISGGASNVNIFNYDGTYPGSNGEVITVCGTYEAA